MTDEKKPRRSGLTEAELDESTNAVLRLAFKMVDVCHGNCGADIEMALLMVLGTTIDKLSNFPGREDWLTKRGRVLLKAPNLDDVARRMNAAERAGQA